MQTRSSGSCYLIHSFVRRSTRGRRVIRRRRGMISGWRMIMVWRAVKISWLDCSCVFQTLIRVLNSLFCLLKISDFPDETRILLIIPLPLLMKSLFYFQSVLILICEFLVFDFQIIFNRIEKIIKHAFCM